MIGLIFLAATYSTPIALIYPFMFGDECGLFPVIKA
jgi:hypothetical protein